ncbi:MAG: glycosyl transferase, partial [Tabrizicola sp.]|nr:glycosyl transferase [Tabrizicola sp.]
MSAQHHRMSSQAAAIARGADEPAPALGVTLLRRGIVAPDDLVHALSRRGREAGRLPDVLRARGMLVDRDLISASAERWGLRVIDLTAPLPDARLIDAIGATDCLRYGLVPWQQIGETTIIALSRPEEFSRLRPMIEARLGPVICGIASVEAVETAILARRGPRLAQAAENRVAAPESCRN